MKTLNLAGVIAALGVASSASAQQPVDPNQSPSTGSVTEPQGAPPAPESPPSGSLMEPYQAADSPAAQSSPPDAPRPPPPPIPPPPYPQNYYPYPPPGSYGYYPPPPPYRAPLYCGDEPCAEARRPWDGVRRFSLGVHGTVLGLSQRVGTHDVVLGGAGFQLRLRSRGHFGFEASQSILHTEYLSGAFVRDSYPFSVSFMAYAFRNSDTRHFNLYALVGFGFMPDSVRVNDQFGFPVRQNFFEWEGHIGAGMQLRFKWFAVDADVRGLGLLRSTESPYADAYAATYGAAVPDRSSGIMGNLYVSFWF